MLAGCKSTLSELAGMGSGQLVPHDLAVLRHESDQPVDPVWLAQELPTYAAGELQADGKAR